MKSYYRVMLGKGSEYANRCFEDNFIGAHFGIHQDLTERLYEDWTSFNKEFIPVYLACFPEKTRIGAGLSCGALWTISKGIQTGDIVLSPNGAGRYRIGTVVGNYFYADGQILPHRRTVEWSDNSIAADEMSDALRNSVHSIGTVCNISRHSVELEKLIFRPTTLLVKPPVSLEADPVGFVFEEHLEAFLEKHWEQTAMGKEYDIYEDEDGKKARQYPTDTGAIDLLAVSKDRKRLLVVELKRGKASDAAVGQTLRYMGFVQENLAKPGDTVHGVIIALDDDIRIRRALSVISNIKFYRYRMTFELVSA